LRHLSTTPTAVLFAAILVLLVAGGPSVLLAQETDAAPDSVEVQETLTDLAQAQQHLHAMRAELDSVLVLETRSRTAENEKLDLIGVQARRRIETLQNLMPQLMKILPQLDEADSAVVAVKQGTIAFLGDEYDIYERALDLWSRQIDVLRDQRSTVADEDQNELETEIGAARERLDRYIVELGKILGNADILGADTEQPWQRHDRMLHHRAESLVGRLQIAVNSRDGLAKKIKTSEKAKADEAEIGPDRARLQYAEARIRGVAHSLEITVDLLSARGFEASQYRQFIIKTTGEVSGRILDPRIFIGLARDFFADIGQWFKDNGATILVKLLIILASIAVFRLSFRLGWWLLRFVGVIKLTRLMTQLGHSLLKPLATIFGLFTGLWLVGADPTTLLTGAGVAGVIIGFALQDSLSNLAAGFFILTTRPFDIDDVIRTGDVVGTVKAMWIANTTVITFDGRRLLIPNRQLWAGVIENRSVEPLRRVDITVRVGFDEDIDRALAILLDLVQGEPRVLGNPEPAIFVSSWEDSWVEISVRPWARNEDWWPLLTDLPRLAVLRFAAEGIKIPYPRREMRGRADQPHNMAD